MCHDWRISRCGTLGSEGRRLALEIIADYHTHTRYSHGSGTVVQNAAAALNRGLAAVGMADHGPRSLPWVRASAADLLTMAAEVRSLDARSPGIRVLSGVEANIVTLDGELDVPRRVRDRLDLLLAGLHPHFIPPTWRDGWTLIGMNWLGSWSPALRRRTRTLNTKAVVEAVCRNPIDIITHPGWGLEIDTHELARACARRGTAMEINAGHGHMNVEYCIAAAREGVHFSIGSDAHRPEDVGAVEPAIRVAEQAGLRPDQIVNARGGPGLARLRGADQPREGHSAGPWPDRLGAAPPELHGPADGTAFTDWASQEGLSYPEADRPR